MDYELLGRVMELVYLDPFYAGSKISAHRNSIYYAIKHGKCLTHTVDGKVVGYCTWGFFTKQELEADSWNGDEVYARADGEVLFFPKFQCRAGRREVIRFARDVQAHFGESYPNVATAAGLRVYPNGDNRPELWHRKPK